ncbi:hypothetical protein Bca101_089643 [Brassica carinata]
MQNAIVSEGQCKQKNCHQECKKSCHVSQTERRVCLLVTPASKTTFLPEELCIGFGICVKRYPLEAVQIIKPNLGRLDICAGLGLDRRAKEVFGGELQWFAIAIGFIEKAETYMLDDSRLLKCGEVTTMSDLPDDLAEEILSRVPLTSLSAVRSTCRKWNDLSKNQVFGKSASTGRKHFLGFMLKDYKVCSMKFDLQGIGNEGDFVDPSIKEVSILDQVEITQYPNRGMADRFMQNAIVSEGQCKQKNCHQECKKSCHVSQTERRVCLLVTPASKTTFLPEELCIGFGICVKRYPLEAVQIIKPNLGRLDICAGLGLDRRAKEVFGGELQWFAIAIGFIEKAETYMLDDSRLLKCGEVTTMSDLPDDLAEEILSRVPLTSLSAVRSTCRKWNDLSKNQVFGKSASTGRKHFLGFMLKDYKVCSMKFDLQGIGNEGDFVDPSIKEVSILDQVEITQVFHCGGLLLCVTKDRSRLLVWNPYLGQTRWIQPRNTFRSEDRYAVGYDKNRNYKILRVFGKYDTKGEFGSVDKYLIFGYEIYDLSFSSWKVFNVSPDWNIDSYQRGVSLKGHTYFLAEERWTIGNFVSLSCVREEQLAVLHQSSVIDHTLEIWVSSNIDLGAVSWSKFLRTTSFCRVDFQAGSFFIDEEKKVAVVVDQDNGGQARTETRYNQRANVIGQDEYFKPRNCKCNREHGKKAMINQFQFQQLAVNCTFLATPFVDLSFSSYNLVLAFDGCSDLLYVDSCCLSSKLWGLHDVYDPNKINVKIKIVSGSPCGAVAAEAKKAQAN